jgi:threonine/homoserine/homoserine lactone efflux protein
MNMTTWWYAAATIFAVMATRGPAMLLGLAVATQHGIRKSLYVGGGVLVAFSMFALVSLSGIGVLVLAEPRVLMILRWFGILYLAWLGTKAFLRFRALMIGQSLSDAVRAAEKSSSFFRHGFLMSLSNMNAVLFFSAIFPQFIDASAPIAPQVALPICHVLRLLAGRILVLRDDWRRHSPARSEFIRNEVAPPLEWDCLLRRGGGVEPQAMRGRHICSAADTRSSQHLHQIAPAGGGEDA